MKNSCAALCVGAEKHEDTATQGIMKMLLFILHAGVSADSLVKAGEKIGALISP